eukprot:1159236-Pelagomonas_calceolata.AAC.4
MQRSGDVWLGLDWAAAGVVAGREASPAHLVAVEAGEQQGAPAAQLVAVEAGEQRGAPAAHRVAIEAGEQWGASAAHLVAVEADQHRKHISGNRVRVSGYRTRVSGYRMHVSGYKMLVSGYRTRVSGYRKHDACEWLQNARKWLWGVHKWLQNAHEWPYLLGLVWAGAALGKGCGGWLHLAADLGCGMKMRCQGPPELEVLELPLPQRLLLALACSRILRVAAVAAAIAAGSWQAHLAACSLLSVTAAGGAARTLRVVAAAGGGCCRTLGVQTMQSVGQLHQQLLECGRILRGDGTLLLVLLWAWAAHEAHDACGRAADAWAVPAVVWAAHDARAAHVVAWAAQDAWLPGGG